MSATCVDRLAELVGLTAKAQAIYDWDAVEGSLGGLHLPHDYKELVESFPRGRFQRFVNVIRPGDINEPVTEYLGYYRYRLEDMRTARVDDEDPASFPYPIHPEPGGLLPWGDGPQGELFYWLTHLDDPDEWQVITSNHTWTVWQSFAYNMCEFLTRVVNGELVDNAYSGDLAVPTFEPRERPRSTASSGPAWVGLREAAGKRPRNDFDVLARVLPPGVRVAHSPDWVQVEGRLGVTLPSDYKSFIDQFGPGRFCDISILGIDCCDDIDLFAALERNSQQAKSYLRPPQSNTKPFYPAPNGIITWGMTSEGRIFGWGPSGSNPDQWGVVAARPFPKVRAVTYLADLSFSSFLLRYAGQGNGPLFLPSSEPWQGDVTFAPH